MYTRSYVTEQHHWPGGSAGDQSNNPIFLEFKTRKHSLISISVVMSAYENTNVGFYLLIHVVNQMPSTVAGKFCPGVVYYPCPQYDPAPEVRVRHCM